ncbi:TPA: hypothetical protein DEG21_03995 [Patescibacteria group bacterium]|nr:hypothetical protein [Candidatus Gracilibacteria bacterium]HBY75010.1 hypothetical protein [Candidatus Gracilibacteria bacterium]
MERFLEKIYLSDKVDNNLFLSYFYLNLKEIKTKFEDTYHIFSEITIFYLKETNIRDLQIIDYVNKKKNHELKIKIDSEIKNFYENKAVFYKNVSDLLNLSAITSVERGYFWKYIKTEIINQNYKEIKRLFYWNKDACSNRNEWALLK